MSTAATYSRLDRVLHHVAFSAVPAQLGIADIEDRVVGARTALPTVSRPVFVTALPRAGTTLLLEVLAGTSGFASHTYRNMPFVLCPLLWDALSRPFRTRAKLRERAHGDGMAVGFDSPEAFEEVIWKAFWPEKYADDRILLWSRDERDERFEAFLVQHIRKILWLEGRGQPCRYLSKNNANIARVELLSAIFPDCRILVPIRSPRDHAESLRRQHLRFSRIHGRDRFALRYMEWLGHYEFGQALRPIDFDGWLDAAPSSDPADPAFWLAYWLAAHARLLALASPNVIFVDYDRLCREPEILLPRLADVLAISDPSSLTARASDIRPGRAYEDAPAPADRSLLNAAEDLRNRILAHRGALDVA